MAGYTETQSDPQCQDALPISPGRSAPPTAGRLEAQKNLTFPMVSLCLGGEPAPDSVRS